MWGMPDFSYYSVVTAEMVGRYAAKGLRPTDEMLLAGLNSIKPSLLSFRDNEAVRAVLSHKRGRPTKSTTPREALAIRIECSTRANVPEAFKSALAGRMRRRKGFTDFERSLRAFKRLQRRKRDMFVDALYRDIVGLLTPGTGSVVHPVLGELTVPKEIARTRSQTALNMTHSILIGFGMYPPSESGMLNIVSNK
jgi:hypothetical protein